MNNSTNNYIKCNYIEHVNPNDLYNSYNGFIRGNMFPDLYNGYKLREPIEIKPENEQADMLTYLDSLSFALVDINLYLDTHPNDREMINLYNRFLDEQKLIMDEYEKMYGPLNTNSNSLKGNSWLWNNSPWPWEY